MPRKGMRSLCFNYKAPSFSRSSPSRASNSAPRRSFSESMIEQTIENAAAMIMKWNPESSTYAKVTSLFYENKREAMQFIKCLKELQNCMYLLISDDSSSEKLVYAQSLMQIAMKRLQKEFYQILSMNRAHLDPESVSTRSSRTSITSRSSASDFDVEDPPDDVRVAGDCISEVEEASSIAMADLRSIAECMISLGYAKECVQIYKVIRKSIIDEAIFRLGVEKMSSSQKINKIDWEVLDIKIKSWLEAMRVALSTLFIGERILCDQVFVSSDSIRESCFTEISKEGAAVLFGFPEIVAKSKKSSPEKMFRLLDMYSAIAENWPQIESIFSFESASTIRLQAINSLVKLSESIRSMLSNFESKILKDSSKSPAPGGDVHSLAIQVMNYLSLLGDYSSILNDIFADWSLPAKSPLPESYFTSDYDQLLAPAASLRIAWLILVLLCKLDSKSKHYKEVSLSYIFLANNLNYVLSRVRTSNLRYILGDDWMTKREDRVRNFTANYERLAWRKVLESLPENPTVDISPEEAIERFGKFSSSFEDAHRKQSSHVIPDPNLRDEIKVSVSEKVVSAYREFYDAHRGKVGGVGRNGCPKVKFAPEDVGHYVSNLYNDAAGLGSPSFSLSWSNSNNRHFWSR